MSRNRWLIIPSVVFVAFVLAAVVFLAMRGNDEKQTLALDPTVGPSPITVPSATVLAQPTETPSVATATAISKPMPRPDHTPALPVWATVTTTEGTTPQSANSPRNALTGLGELFYQAHTGAVSFTEYADKLYSAFAADAQATCSKETFVNTIAPLFRDAAGPIIPSSKEDLQRLREDLDRFYTEAVVIGISEDGTQAQADEDLSTAYHWLTMPLVLEGGGWKVQPDFPICPK